MYGIVNMINYQADWVGRQESFWCLLLFIIVNLINCESDWMGWQETFWCLLLFINVSLIINQIEWDDESGEVMIGTIPHIRVGCKLS